MAVSGWHSSGISNGVVFREVVPLNFVDSEFCVDAFNDPQRLMSGLEGPFNSEKAELFIVTIPCDHSANEIFDEKLSHEGERERERNK